MIYRCELDNKTYENLLSKFLGSFSISYAKYKERDDMTFTKNCEFLNIDDTIKRKRIMFDSDEGYLYWHILSIIWERYVFYLSNHIKIEEITKEPIMMTEVLYIGSVYGKSVIGDKSKTKDLINKLDKLGFKIIFTHSSIDFALNELIDEINNN